MSHRHYLSPIPLTVAVPLLLAVFVPACSPRRAEAYGASDEAVAAVPVRVLPVHTSRQPATVRVSGVTEARTTSDVAFQVSGKVVAVGVDEGDVVAAGQFLAQIDPTDYRLALAQAELARLRAADELARADALRATNSIAPDDYDKIRTQALATTVSHDEAAKHLSDARLVAPFAGIVSHKGIERGSTAAVGTPVFTVVDLSEIEVRLGVPESDISAVQPGRPATIAIAGLPGRTFSGRVKLAGVAADSATRTYTIKIAVPNPRHDIKTGMVAVAAVAATGETTVMGVPGSAIMRDSQGATVVYVYNPTDQRVHQRRVELGEVSGQAVDVRDGLSDGELIVIAGQTNVRDGVAVVAEQELTDSAQRTTTVRVGRGQP